MCLCKLKEIEEEQISVVIYVYWLDVTCTQEGTTLTGMKRHFYASKGKFKVIMEWFSIRELCIALLFNGEQCEAW